MKLYTQKEEPVPAFPGHNPGYVSPRPVARVRPEAQEIANKNRGSLELFGSGEPKPIYTPQPEPKCNTADARRNYELGRNGMVSSLLNGQATPRPDSTRVQRVGLGGAEVAQNHTGSSTAMLFNSYGKLPVSARAVPRIKQEAEGNAEQHKGGRMNCLMHSPRNLPSTPKPEPRVKPEAQEIAGKEGRAMNKTIHSYATPLSTRPVPRVKGEAMASAEKAKGGETMNMFYKYGKLPLNEKPEPKVKAAGQEMANLDKGGRMSRLMHEGSRLPQDPKPVPRATTSSARRIMKAHRGQISEVFSHMGSKQVAYLGAS